MFGLMSHQLMLNLYGVDLSFPIMWKYSSLKQLYDILRNSKHLEDDDLNANIYTMGSRVFSEKKDKGN